MTCKPKADDVDVVKGKSVSSATDKAAPTITAAKVPRVNVRDAMLPPKPVALLVAEDDPSPARSHLLKLWTAACTGGAADKTALGFALSDEFSELPPDFAGACAWLRAAQAEGDNTAVVQLAMLSMVSRQAMR